MEKCLLMIMDFNWNEGKWSYKEVNLEIKLYVPITDGSMHIIKQTAVKEAVFSLGVHQAPDVNSIEHLDHKVKKVEKWTKKMKMYI